MENQQQYNKDYPIGGMLEPYDIWREKQLLEQLQRSDKPKSAIDFMGNRVYNGALNKDEYGKKDS